MQRPYSSLWPLTLKKRNMNLGPAAAVAVLAALAAPLVASACRGHWRCYRGGISGVGGLVGGGISRGGVSWR